MNEGKGFDVKREDEDLKAEETGFVEDSPMVEDEKTGIYSRAYKKLEPSAQNCMRLNAVIGGVILMALAETGMYFLLYKRNSVLFWIITAIVVLLVVVMDVLITPKFRYERYRYRINERDIRVREGYIWIKETIVPIERLHKIEISQGPIDRLFKLSSLEVTTAGGDCVIKFINTEEAEMMAERLKDKINEIAKAERRVAG